MIHLLTGAFILSLFHALIPNHWLPLVAIGKGEGWSRGETLLVTAIAGGAHVAGTIIIGLIIGLIGIGITSSFKLFMNTASPVIIVLLGLIFVGIDLKGGHKLHHMDLDQRERSRKSKVAIIVSLASAMFLSPCLEIEAYYFTAGSLGWPAIFGVSAVYLLITLSGMLFLVFLGLQGLEKLRWTYLERHEKRVTGLVLVVLGIGTYLLNTDFS